MAFFPHWCVIGLIPWAGAALLSKDLIANIMCVWGLFYVFLHLAQVWQLREDLDVVESAFATLLGTATMLWGRAFGTVGSLDPQEALRWPTACAIVVLVHFL